MILPSSLFLRGMIIIKDGASMPISDCNFWCIHHMCFSYHTGECCDRCSCFMQCHDCVLQDHDLDVSCELFAYYITHGFPEGDE